MLIVVSVVLGWMLVCALVVAVCASAKEGDGLVVPVKGLPRRARRRRLATVSNPALPS